MIQMQLLSHPHPFPQPFPHPLCPPQQQRRRMIQIILFPHPHPPHPLEGASHPHPQLVAAKSLMFFPPGKISLHFQYMQNGMSDFPGENKKKSGKMRIRSEDRYTCSRALAVLVIHGKNAYNVGSNHEA